jgi:hypothetical protein
LPVFVINEGASCGCCHNPQVIVIRVLKSFDRDIIDGLLVVVEAIKDQERLFPAWMFIVSLGSHYDYGETRGHIVQSPSVLNHL